MEKPNIAIIGAGMTGVVCARNLKDAGYETIIFEKVAVLAAVWRHGERAKASSLITAPNTLQQKINIFEFHRQVKCRLCSHWKIEEKVLSSVDPR